MHLYEMTATQLQAGLQAGDFSSVDLVKALHQRADQVEGAVNGFTMQLREQALQEARLADEERTKGNVKGPLHGIPITVKDNIDVEGTPTTLGMQARRECVAGGDAVIVQSAREAGAIVLGKSNVPQALIPMHCTNRIFGVTSNPWSSEHVTGGSSGGEGALIASGESVMGLGSDLGGSIRFPAAFCGIAGFKPTTNRWSNMGSNTAIVGQEFVRAQLGPMARSAEDLCLMFEALESRKQHALDLSIPPVPSRSMDEFKLSGMRIGYYTDDGFITPAPSHKRAVEMSCTLLKEAGAELVEFPPLNQQEVIEHYVAAVSSDGMGTLKQALQGEPVVDELKSMWRLGHLPSAFRQTAAHILPWMGEERLSGMLKRLGAKSTHQLWQLTASRSRLQAAAYQAWQASGVDVVVCPASALPAVPIDLSSDLSLIFSYFGRYNLFCMPAGVLPVTKVLSDELGRDDKAPSDRLGKLLNKATAQSEGLPVAVQVVGKPWQDEKVLAVMKWLEARFRLHEHFPLTPVSPFALSSV